LTGVAIEDAGKLEILTRYVEKFPGGELAKRIADGFENAVRSTHMHLPPEHIASGLKDFVDRTLTESSWELDNGQYEEWLKGSESPSS